MAIFEAICAITELSGVFSRKLQPTITLLQLFVSSSKPALRFVALRILDKVSQILNSLNQQVASRSFFCI